MFFRKLVLPALIPLQHSAENDVKGRFFMHTKQIPNCGCFSKIHYQAYGFKSPPET